MSDVRFASLNGSSAVVPGAAVDEFAGTILGGVLRQGDHGYDEARTLWNAMIDRRPALIARCRGTADVINSVRFARTHNLLVSVRGAGHNIAGKASSDQSLMIDLSAINGVRVDPETRTVRTGPGATLGMVDHETQAFGLATPLGINSITGISGLTLGGGIGWLSRSLGLTIDNLLSADVVTAEGKLVKASEKENADLFWGLRGGGGNFGIVTSFEFRVHPIGPTVLAGLIVHPFADAHKVLHHYRSFVSGVSDKLSCWVVLRKAPPLPFLPQEVHGKEIVVLALLYAGDIKEGEKIVEPLRKFGQPIADVVGPSPYTGFQQAFDPLLTPGFRNYWKSHNFTELPDGLIDSMIEYTGKLPTALSEIVIGNLGGAVNRVATDATAYPHRDATFFMNVHTRWEDKDMDSKCVAWAREFADAAATYATGGVYVNFISEGEKRVANAFGENFRRLEKLKKAYDPDNFFRINQNITPAAGSQKS